MNNLLQKVLTTEMSSKMFENPFCETYARRDLKKNILDNDNGYSY
jgi:hypothetical protein